MLCRPIAPVRKNGRKPKISLIYPPIDNPVQINQMRNNQDHSEQLEHMLETYGNPSWKPIMAGSDTGAQELSTVAVSPWLVACGLSNGEVRLFAALHGLAELGPLPMRHGAEVLSLSFGQLGKVGRSDKQ